MMGGMGRRPIDFCDEPARDVENPDDVHGEPSRLPARGAAVGALVFIASTLLPWYGVPNPLDPANFSGFHLGPGSYVPFSDTLFPRGWAPGGRGFGVVLLLTVAGVLVIARLLRRNPGLRLVATTLAILSATLVVLTSLECAALPPYGDGAPLRPDWGMLLGLMAALATLASSIAGVVIALRLHSRDRGSAGT